MDSHEIAQAILENRCVDGSRIVLDGASGEPGRQEFVPPIAKTAREVRAIPGAHRWEPGATLRVAEFEALSLAARAAAIADQNGRRPTRDRFPVLSADDVMSAIAEVAEKIDFDQSGGRRSQRDGRSLNATATDAETRRLLSRRGLQIVGCRIRGDVVLVNARLPFSVRFIGCVVEGAVVVDHCELTTLDLSGSVVRGLHGSFLNARGSVRLRRTVSTGPVDLGGARVRGLVDASDCIVLPFHPPPNSEVFVGDRGAFNISLSNLENELHCNRARIYGGLNLKGAVVQRSIFMEQVILLSPLGLLERMLTEIAIKRMVSVPDACRKAFEDDLSLANESRSQPQPSSAALKGDLSNLTSPEVDLEMMRPLLLAVDEKPVFSRLMVESSRACTAALRGDGLRIDGSFFAREMKAAGRVRLKYAHVGGGLHLSGGRLRSVEDIDACLNSADPASMKNENGGQAKAVRYRDLLAKGATGRELLALRSERAGKIERAAGERTQDALDLRDASLGGQLALHAFRDEPDVFVPTSIHGVIALAGAAIGEDLRLENARFHKKLPDGSDRDGCALFLDGAVMRGGLHLEECDGLFGIQALRLEVRSGVFLADRIERDAEGAWPESPPRRATNVSGKIDFTNAVIAADATFLFDADNGPDIDLQHARVEGRLTIAPLSANYVLPPKTYWDANDAAKKRRRKLAKLIKTGGNMYRELRGMPSVDLRHAYARSISHAPSAWPKQSGLLLSGFRYDGYRGLGPFVVEEDLARYMLERPQRWNGFWLSFTAVVGLATGISLALVAGQGPLLRYLGALFLNEIPWVGRWNLAFLVAVAAGAAVASIVRRQSRRVLPMAIPWLERQRLERHPLRSAVIWPLEPYVRAARALRANGDHVAANRVELARLRTREHMQDWRSYFMGKLFLKLVSLVARYGYGLGRTVVWIVFSIALAAAVFQDANSRGLMKHSRDDGGRPRFVSQVYAMDLIVPLVGLSQETDWRPASGCQDPKADTETCPQTNGTGGAVKFFVYAAWAFRCWGLLLTSIVVAAITARAEVMFAKIDE